MSAYAETKEQLDAALTTARTIAHTVQREDRDFTQSESDKVKAALNRAKRLKETLAQLPAPDSAELKSLFNAEGIPVSWGEPVKGSRLSAGSWGKAMIDHLGAIGAKALTPSGTVVAPAAWDARVVTMGERPVWLTDIIPTDPPISGEEFAYWRQTVRTNNAAPVAKGGLKPTSVITAEKVTDKVKTIAHLSEPVYRQDVADSDSLVQFLEGELRLGYRLTVDTQIIQGDGTGENFPGLATLSGIQTHAKGTDSNIVAARKALTKAQLSLEPPSHFVMNPNDLEKFDLAVDNEQRYYFGGPQTVGIPKLWGLPVVGTEATPAGTAYVGAFSTMAALKVREDVRIDWSENTDDDFTKNLIRWRAEGRSNVQWFRPFAFVKITGIA